MDQPVKDEDIIRKCREGDRQAQRLLYDRYQGQMYRLCLRYLRDQQEAEDVLCRAFFKVFNAIGQFEERGENSLQKWMTRIFVNEALMVLRRSRLETVPEEEGWAVPSATRSDGAVDAEYLHALILALPLGYRTVFNLHAIEGYSHPEIAAQLGISEGTSKSQLSKARAMLQDMLNPKEKNNATEYRSAV